MKIEIKECRKPNAEEEALKVKVRQMMQADRCRLLESHPFVGHLAMHLDMIPVIDSRMTTAATDGTRMFMDAEFYSKMDEDERLGIIGHEVWHCALRHFQRLGDRDRKKFNFACDVEVDLLLHRDGFKVEVLPHEASWEGKSAEQIYDLMFPGLEQFQKDDEHIFDSDKLPGDTDGENDGDVSDGENGRENEEEKDSSGQEQNGDSGKSNDENGSGRSPITGNADLPSVNHEGVIDPDFQPEREKELAEDWKDHLKNAVQQEMKKGGKGIGNLPGNVEDLIKDEDKVATIDWKKVLLDYVSQLFGGDRQWLPPARRYVWKKLYLPSRAKKQSIEIVLAIDTSGSTTEDLPDFLAELRGMTSAFGEYKLTIIQCDTRIRSVKEYSNDDPLPEKLQFYGFGGTSLIPPFNYVKGKTPPTVFIYLTDGFSDAPAQAPDFPVIWCLTKGGKKPANWGLEVKIKEK